MDTILPHLRGTAKPRDLAVRFQRLANATGSRERYKGDGEDEHDREGDCEYDCEGDCEYDREGD